MASWSLLLADLSGTTLGEITNASDRKLSFPLNRMATGSFRVRLDHPLGEDLLDGDRLVKVYQEDADGTSQIRMVGEIVSVEEVASESDSGSLAVTFAEAGFWRLTHRLVGKSGTGVSYGTALSPVDRGSIAQSIITAVNGDADTGIRIGTISASASGYVGPWYYKQASEALLELSSTLDGFDFRFSPVEPYSDASGLVIGEFDAAAVLGTTRSDMVFEFGTGRRNIKEIKRQVGREGLLTKGYHLPPGFPESSAPVVSVEDTIAEAERGLHESLITSDLSVADLRLALTEEHVEVRRQPRQLITFEPTAYANEFNDGYEVGDIVQARAAIEGSVRFNAFFRIYGVDLSLSPEGLPTYAITLVPED